MARLTRVTDWLVRWKSDLIGAVERLLHDKLSDTINVKDFGAKGDGVTDDAPAINAALAGGGRVIVIPKGDYYIRSYLRLYSNTKVIMEPGCTILNDNQVGESAFLNGEFGNANYASGYDGESNITIVGGCIDNRIMKAVSRQSNAIGIAHGTNIKIEDVVFKNNYKSHFVEINSSKDVSIRNCIFDTLDAANVPGNRSMINIDYAFQDGFPPFGSYDGTVCKNVIIEDCSFYNGDSAVDSHSSPASGGYHSNINVINCHIENMLTSGISPRFWADSAIDNCTFFNAGSRTIRAWSAKRFRLSNSTFLGGGSQYSYSMAVDDVTKIPVSHIISNCTFESVTGACIVFTGGSHMVVDSCVATGCGGNLVSQAYGTTDLTISGCASAGSTGIGSPFQFAGDSVTLSGCQVVDGAYQFAVNLQGSNSNVVVSGCRLKPGTNGTIRFTSLCKIDGKWHISLGNDAVVSIPLGDSTGNGIVTVSGNWLQSGSTINGCYQVRGGSGTEAISTYYSLSPSPSIMTGVLTGTTGPAGAISLSVSADNKVYLENRTGSSRFFVIDMVAF